VEPTPVPATTAPIRETPGEGGETSPSHAAAEEPPAAAAAAEVEGERETPSSPTATVAAPATRLSVGIASLPSSPLRPSSAPAVRSRADALTSPTHSPATPHRPHPSGVPKSRPQSAAVSGSSLRNVDAGHDARQPPMPRQPVRPLPCSHIEHHAVQVSRRRSAALACNSRCPQDGPTLQTARRSPFSHG
jgi:hypothetical protein